MLWFQGHIYLEKTFLSESFMLTYKHSKRGDDFGNEIIMSGRFSFRVLLVIALQYSCLIVEGKAT